MATYTYLGGLPAGNRGDPVAVDIAGAELRIAHRPTVLGKLLRRSPAWSRRLPLAALTNLTLDSGANLAAQQALLWGLPGMAGPWEPDKHYLVIYAVIDDQEARIILTGPEPTLRDLRRRIDAAAS